MASEVGLDEGWMPAPEDSHPGLPRLQFFIGEEQVAWGKGPPGILGASPSTSWALALAAKWRFRQPS